MTRLTWMTRPGFNAALDPSKLCGPDNIPARILKYCCDEIAPVLTVIFIQSLNSGNLPEDWLSANVTPIFKKRR